MPYGKEEIPDAVKDYPKKAQDIFREVWNKEYEKHGDEGRAFATAWTAVRKAGYGKTHASFINFLLEE